MTTTAARRSPAGGWVPPIRRTVEWHDTAGAVEHLMRVERLESVDVMADGERIGGVTRRDIARCANHGNWLEAVLIRDLVGGPIDTCN